ncbi:hypothetical protein SKAU_G00387360 [Synaphobranchus kaupii]|uniref:CCHC-type domain-containing protein n=1 Tax=Synaphobranchus kaupii TaxID=118154 RepID=A0A9Q1EAV7_SYNKA|nr:hypothetical protein SKAU_G00387360 [Synaphobranchus kaupii]
MLLGLARIKDPQGVEGFAHPPGSFAIEPDRGYLFYPGQPVYCRRCGSFGHLKESCTVERCKHCSSETRDHKTKDPKQCSQCGSTNHLFRACPERVRTYAGLPRPDLAGVGNQGGLIEQREAQFRVPILLLLQLWVQIQMLVRALCRVSFMLLVMIRLPFRLRVPFRLLLQLRALFRLLVLFQLQFLVWVQVLLWFWVLLPIPFRCWVLLRLRVLFRCLALEVVLGPSRGPDPALGPAAADPASGAGFIQCFGPKGHFVPSKVASAVGIASAPVLEMDPAPWGSQELFTQVPGIDPMELSLATEGLELLAAADKEAPASWGDSEYSEEAGIGWGKVMARKPNSSGGSETHKLLKEEHAIVLKNRFSGLAT